MIRVIDQNPTHVVQKITAPSGAVIAYQAAPRDKLGDTAQVTRVSTLAEARRVAGVSCIRKEG